MLQHPREQLEAELADAERAWEELCKERDRCPNKVILDLEGREDAVTKAKAALKTSEAGTRPFGVHVKDWKALLDELKDSDDDCALADKPLLVKAIRVLEECLSRRMRRAVDQTDSYLKSFEKLFGLQAKAELAAILLDMDSINQR